MPTLTLAFVRLSCHGKGALPVLERLELHVRTNKSETTTVPPTLQIKHVMPRKWASNWTLKGCVVPPNVAEFPHLATGELQGLREAIRARNVTLHSLGNLTLLNEHLNPAVSNAGFESKRDAYKNSVLRLNRYF